MATKNPRTLERAEERRSLHAVLAAARRMQKGLANDSRMEFWREIAEGYCIGCGRALSFGETCYCQNDE